MKILHLVRQIADERALSTVTAQSRNHDVAVVLLQDAVLTPLEFPGTTYACREDVEARGAGLGLELVDYRRIVQLIGEYEKVVSW
ncbi:MAG: sulfurtransferase TusB [Chloroflexota bacterium]|nr:MAG: sulfurtransferase TusB [Chloroflexota bacterium]